MSNVDFIVYLEPDSEFKQAVDEYLNEMERNYGPTTANKYGCHISMTGFFTANDENTIDEIIAFLNCNHFGSRDVPQINLNGIIVRDKLNNTPKHLLLSINAPSLYHNLMKSLSNIVPLRLKRIDHISLAYWDEPEATLDQQNNWMKRLEDGVFEKMKHDADVYFKDIKPPTGWDIVLYKRVFKGVLVGQHHEFTELGRWPSSTGI